MELCSAIGPGTFWPIYFRCPASERPLERRQGKQELSRLLRLLGASPPPGGAPISAEPVGPGPA
eukprot:10881355-Heterocapsa_arctica.AAC.1